MAGGRNDEVFMRHALALAERGLGETNPNPLVGCVLVRGGRVVGEGFHARAGGPHAEPIALAQAGDRARGATAYVTLEPCSHQGRTPPCAPRLVAAGVRRVVFAQRDPNPLVSGRGASLLRRAGLSVEAGLLAREAGASNETFLLAARLTRPFVLLKTAQTLDGRIASASGDSKWITSPAQRRAARALRRLHDAVVVGIGTVLADDPLLLPTPRTRRPFTRVVFDSHLRLPLGARLVRSLSHGPVWVVCRDAPGHRRRELERAGVRVLCQADEGGPTPAAGRVPVAWALRALRREGLWSVMVEGGSEVLGAFLAARAFDQVALFRAPLLLGGRGSRPSFGGPDPARIRDALRLSPTGPFGPALLARRIGDPELFEVWYPGKPPGARGAGAPRLEGAPDSLRYPGKRPGARGAGAPRLEGAPDSLRYPRKQPGARGAGAPRLEAAPDSLRRRGR
jgi:diaminohydroxyphosphoribosylaminopyrimidine deaminase/5-amino-6-(5-phosphoribosylamino)uracil reductase